MPPVVPAQHAPPAECVTKTLIMIINNTKYKMKVTLKSYKSNVDFQDDKEIHLRISSKSYNFVFLMTNTRYVLEILITTIL
jgi:hypothetical protein